LVTISTTDSIAYPNTHAAPSNSSPMCCGVSGCPLALRKKPAVCRKNATPLLQVPLIRQAGAALNIHRRTFAWPDQSPAFWGNERSIACANGGRARKTCVSDL
jgi:hypothetical protein